MVSSCHGDDPLTNGNAHEVVPYALRAMISVTSNHVVFNALGANHTKD
jgi:hypothetical protein